MPTGAPPGTQSAAKARSHDRGTMAQVERIAALLDDALAHGLGSAAAISVGDGGREVGRVVRGHARRLPDLGAPIDDATWFDLASVTKPMVAAAAAVLVGEGRLALGDPIRRWIPTAASAGTVADLLAHAAGCVAHIEFFRTLARGGISDPRTELVRLAAREPAGSPNVAELYSDLGFIMLGAIVERAADALLEDAFAELVAAPLDLATRFAGLSPIAPAVATELADVHGLARGLVCGRVHDENAFYSGGACGHAGLFSTLGDVARFAAAIADTAAGTPRGRLRTEVVQQFATTTCVPNGGRRLGWDTPSAEPGVSHAGDRWPRTGAVGHTGFTGTSLWLDLPRRRWVVLLTNRVHPTRHDGSADAIKTLRRAVHDAAIDLLDGA
jgi:CubicO group peptidase (beta-lactamase class C family)